MHREILFRGKPIVCEELMEPNETLKEFFKRQHGWSDYGVNEAFTDDGFVIGQVVYGHEKVWIVGEVVEAEENYIALEYWVPVYPETVGQYTGLKDKNGVEIFYGDIVRMHQFLFDGSGYEKEIVGVIKQGDYGWTLSQIKNKEVNDHMGYENGEGETYLIDFCGLHEESFEKIGNIHDNPELLEVLGNGDV